MAHIKELNVDTRLQTGNDTGITSKTGLRISIRTFAAIIFYYLFLYLFKLKGEVARAPG